MTSHARPSGRTAPALVAVVTAKPFRSAKARLSAALAEPLRARLAAAMLGDTLGVLATTLPPEAIVAVVGDDAGAEVARSHGAIVVRDEQLGGQSEAALLGVALAQRQLRARTVIILPADVPALTGEDLAALVEAANRDAIVIVPDRHGSGTNALALTPPDALRPAFGPDSLARHRRLARCTGRSWRILRLRSLALDIDTPGDLAELARVLAGRPERGRTARVLAEIAATDAGAAGQEVSSSQLPSEPPSSSRVGR